MLIDWEIYKFRDRKYSKNDFVLIDLWAVQDEQRQEKPSAVSALGTKDIFFVL
jgi:hypothetical protein